MSSVKQNKSSLGIHVIIALCTFALMSYVYYYDTSVYWAYTGFSRDANALRFITAIMVLFGFIIAIPTKSSVRSFLLTASIYASLLPALVLFSLGNTTLEYFFALLSGFFIIFAISALPAKRVSLFTIKLPTLHYIILGTSITLLVLIALYTKFRYFNLSIFKVYEYRSAASDLLPGIFAYFLSPVSKILIPMGVLLGMYRGKKNIVLISFFLGILLFGFTSHKSVLVAPFFVWIVYLAMQKTRSLLGIHIIFLLVATFGIFEFILGNVINEEGKSHLFANVFIRRVFFLPPLLDNLYIEYFSHHDFFHWAKSRITLGTIYTNYDTTAPFIIGEHYFNRTDMSANTGFIGSGFANAGFIGIGIYSLIIARFIAFLGAQGRYIGAEIVASASLILFLSIIRSTDTITAFITHGALILLIIFTLFQRKTA